MKKEKRMSDPNGANVQTLFQCKRGPQGTEPVICKLQRAVARA